MQPWLRMLAFLLVMAKVAVDPAVISSHQSRACELLQEKLGGKRHFPCE